MTHLATKQLNPPFQLKSSDWVTYSEPAGAKLAGLDATDLMAESAKLPGVLRYARMPTGTMLIGEYPVDPVDADYLRSRDRLQALVKGTGPARQSADQQEVETLLDESVPDCTWNENRWVVPPAGEVSIERIVRIVPGGVCVDAVLAAWESQDRLHREALAEFLCRAQAVLRLARIELSQTEVRVVSQVETPFLSIDLGHSLQGVAKACRTLINEVTALAVPELATAYLEFLRQQGAVS